MPDNPFSLQTLNYVYKEEKRNRLAYEAEQNRWRTASDHEKSLFDLKDSGPYQPRHRAFWFANDTFNERPLNGTIWHDLIQYGRSNAILEFANWVNTNPDDFMNMSRAQEVAGRIVREVGGDPHRVY
jgi:hypothetical protein